MKRYRAALLAAGIAISAVAPDIRAAVNVERQSAENPVVEVSRSVIYGGLAGLVLGSAIALANEGNNDGDIIRWCFVGGTVVGFAAGVYFVASRPQPRAVLELDGGARELRAPQLERTPLGSTLVPVVGVRF